MLRIPVKDVFLYECGDNYEYYVYNHLNRLWYREQPYSESGTFPERELLTGFIFEPTTYEETDVNLKRFLWKFYEEEGSNKPARITNSVSSRYLVLTGKKNLYRRIFIAKPSFPCWTKNIKEAPIFLKPTYDCWKMKNRFGAVLTIEEAEVEYRSPDGRRSVVFYPFGHYDDRYDDYVLAKVVIFVNVVVRSGSMHLWELSMNYDDEKTGWKTWEENCRRVMLHTRERWYLRKEHSTPTNKAPVSLPQSLTKGASQEKATRLAEYLLREMFKNF